MKKIFKDEKLTSVAITKTSGEVLVHIQNNSETEIILAASVLIRFNYGEEYKFEDRDGKIFIKDEIESVEHSKTCRKAKEWLCERGGSRMEFKKVLPEDLVIIIFIDEIELSLRLSDAIQKIKKELEENKESDLEEEIEREMKKLRGEWGWLKRDLGQLFYFIW